MKNKHFHYYWALWEKFCLDQGSCTSAASVRWGLVGNTLLTLQRATIGILEVNWPEANKLCLLILYASRWTSPSPQLFILPSCVFSGASHFWRRRDICLCLAWWDPDLHCSMCMLWRRKTKARRFGGHSAEKSEPSHQWDLTKAELVPDFWGKEGQLLGYGWVPYVEGNGQQRWHEDTGSAALTFTWWGLIILLHSENQSSLTHTNCITSYNIWLTLSNLECRTFLHTARAISLGCVCMCVSMPGTVQDWAHRPAWGEQGKHFHRVSLFLGHRQTMNVSMSTTK